MDPVTLRGERLLLRPPVLEDADALLAACSDPAIARWTSVPSPYTRFDALHWVSTEAPSGWAQDRHLVWYAFAEDDPNTLLASIGLHHLDLAARDAEVGYWTVAGARGRGVATAAVAVVARWAFDELGLERIGWEAAVGNDGSRRVAEKLGFTFEGVARSRLPLDGHRDDAWLAGLLPGELVGPARGGVQSAAVQAAAELPPAEEIAPESNEIEITAGSLHLRPWRPEDRDDLVAAVTDPDIARWNPFRGTGSPLEIADTYLAGQAVCGPEAVPFAVVDATTGELLGGVVLTHLTKNDASAELGYWTMPAARGRGVARRAAGALSRWGFAGLGLDRIELFHAVGNTASCDVAEAAGFRREATLRSSYRYGDGLRHDEHLHGRLALDPEPS